VPCFAWPLRLARNVAVDHMWANRLIPTDAVLDPKQPLERNRIVRCRQNSARNAAARAVSGSNLRDVVGLPPVAVADRMSRSKSSLHASIIEDAANYEKELERLKSTRALGAR
jgi:hypothetical protein